VNKDAVSYEPSLAQRSRGLPTGDVPTQWATGPALAAPGDGGGDGRQVWPGRLKLEPLGPDVEFGQGIAMPASVQFRFANDGGGPDAAGTVEVLAGVPELVAFEVRSRLTGGVRSRHLRWVAPDLLVDHVVASTAITVTEVHPGVWRNGDPEAAVSLKALDERRKRGPGRPPVADEVLRRAAAVYAQAEAGGKPRQAVRDVLGLGSWSTVDGYIRRARELGYLPPAPKRKG